MANDGAGEPAMRFVGETLARESIYLAQTPQAFRREVLARRSRSETRADVTDEATLAERAGHPVRLVEGEATNIKLTMADDLTVATAIARRQSGLPARTGRAGTGYDLHRLVPNRPLVLGGVTIPSEVGALGHSDADVVCHAITDAVLGAVGLGDIGSHFPDDDARWKDANSLDLLARAVESRRRARLRGRQRGRHGHPRDVQRSAGMSTRCARRSPPCSGSRCRA